MDEGVGIDAFIIDISKAFDLVPHDRLRMELAALGVDSRVVVRVKELLLGRTQRARVGGKLSKDVKLISGVPQGTILGLLLFLMYVKDIGRNIVSNIRLFADDKRNLQTDLETGGMAGRKWRENKSR